MTAPDADEPVLFAEPGSSASILVIGPLIAAAGIAAESTAPGGATYPLWLGAGLIVFLYTLLVMRARRRHLRVRLTPTVLVQGAQELPVSHISRVRPDDGEPPLGIRVLGDGPVVPRQCDAMVLRLTDGAQVVAWARDGDGLRRELETLTAARRPGGAP